MKKYLYMAFAALLPALVACDDFLDKEPHKNADKTVETVEQLDALMATYGRFFEDANPSFIATDDYGLSPEIQQQRLTTTLIDDLNDFTWSGENGRSSTLWDAEWTKIFTANLVLWQIDNVTGDEDTRENVRAEAHFLRAYSMFNLAVTYCLYPSSANGAELGLPLKTTTSFEESVARASLAQTFSFIENDIIQAVKTTKSIKRVDAKNCPWRCTKASANALAARFYLYMGDMAKAAGYAEKALADYDNLVDFNDPAKMSTSVYYWDYASINAGTADARTFYIYYASTMYPLDWDVRFFLWWDEAMYSRLNYDKNGWYIPSQSLLDTYTHDIKDANPDNDLRYHYFMIPEFSVLKQCKPTNDGIFPGYVQFDYGYIFSGMTVAEMYLIRAEATAYTNVGDAMNILNTLRKTRIATSAYAALTASDRTDALKKIAEERRREMPFSTRWYDLKRYNNNDDASDDVTVTHKFYPYNSSLILMDQPIQTYVLEPKSRKYALPIPTLDITRSEGQLIQNRY